MVNTFIPYSNYKLIAKILDSKRLGKQRVEAMQILNILEGKNRGTGWINHPVVKMWKGHTESLKQYYNEMVREWVRRGYRNTMKLYKINKPHKPWFVKCISVNLSHQASLLRKNPAYYKELFKCVPKKYLKYSYIWVGNLTIEQLKLLKSTCGKNTIIDIAQVAKKI